jgi:hypothetical protein
VFKAQTSSSNAVDGLVPAPSSANTTKYLRGDGTWQTPYSVATTTLNGLMSSSWVSKMDRITVTPDGITAIGEYGTPTKGVYVYATGLYYTPDNSKVYSVIHTGNIGSYAITSLTKSMVTTALGYTPPTTNTTYDVVTSSVAGLAPKIGTAASATIGTQSTEWVLTSTSGGTPTWRKLPENAFKDTNTTYNARKLVGDYTYDLGSFYNYTNGCLIEIGTASIYTMVAIHVTGNGYGATKPINSMYQFYDYDASNGIIHAGAICLGAPTGDMVAYRYNNKVYAWIKQQQQYQTLSFRLYTNQSELSPVVTNAAAHTYGISNKITISPSGIYAGDSSKLGGVAASSYATKDDIANGNITAAKATTADSANAIGGKGLNDLVQGGGTIKYIKVVTSLPASPSNDTLYLIKQ